MTKFLFEQGKHWVIRVEKGYEVYENSTTVAVRRGFFGDGIPGGAFERAVEFAKKREVA